MSRRILLSICLVVATAGAQQRPAATRGFSVSGRVVNALTGEAVAKAIVQLAPVTARGQVQAYETETDGSFEFHGLSAGKYSLIGQGRGFPPQTFDQHGLYSTAIATGANNLSTGLIFRLQPEASISGRILDEHNEPVREAEVLLFAKSNNTGKKVIERQRQARTDDQGEYHFRHLQAGGYYVVVAAQPWYRRFVSVNRRNVPAGEQGPLVDPALDVAYPVTYYPGVTSAEEAGAIVLHPGDGVTANFDLAPVQALHLTIHTGNSEGGPQAYPNFRQKIFGDSGGASVQPTIFYERGDIEVSGLAPGSYSLNELQTNGARAANRVQDVNLQESGELRASDGSGLEGIHGTLKLDGGRSLQNLFLQFVDSGSASGMNAQVDENGEFTVQPEHAGRYTVALANAQGFAIRSISAVGGKVSGRTVEISGTQPVELTIEASEGVGVVNGTVMNADQPLSGAMVVLVPQQISDNLTLFRRDQSDSDGTFTLRDVVPGRYTVLAIQKGWEMEWASAEALRPYLAKGTPVQISGKQELDVKVAAQ